MNASKSTFLGVFAVSALLLGGCSGDEASTPSAASAPDTRRDSATLASTSPLTGLPAKDGLPEHPVFVVKVDNTPGAAPQVGLASADLVVEQLVEGGLTRLAAFYYSQTPAEVGPVRSMRATDIGIVKPVGGTLVASGGAQRTIKKIDAAGVPVKSEEAGDVGLLSQDPARVIPYDRIGDLKTLAEASEAQDPPSAYLPFGDEADLEAAKPAVQLSVSFSGTHQTEWAFAGGHYTRQNGLAADGEEFVADNLLVLEAEVQDAGYVDAAGSGVPETIFSGTGKARLFSDGKAVAGTWAKKSLDSALTLESSSDEELTIPPGKSWIELVPDDAGKVTIGR